MLTVVDLFCGAGGLSAGFASAKLKLPNKHTERFRIVYGADRDKDAITSFRSFHFPKVSRNRVERIAPCVDIIHDVTVESILEAIYPAERVDVLIGGPSCQGLSAAGLRNPADPRNQTLRAFIHLVAGLQPQWFVLENVPGLTHANNRELLAAILQEFGSIDNGNYRVEADVLLAAEYGVAQLRYRLFVIGTRTGAPIRFPLPTHSNPHPDQMLFDAPFETVHDAIGDLADTQPYIFDEDGLPENQAVNRGQVQNHFCIKITPTNQKRIATIKPGYDWRQMPISLLPERYFATRTSDQKGAYGRLHWDWPSYTLTNAVSNVTAGPFTHPAQNRSLSVREAARLQSFSDNHVFLGSVSSQYRQIGNAVPPKLAEAVARGILLSHYQPEEAANWGRQGRLNYDVLCQTIVEGKPFPIMTPRQINPFTEQLERRTTPKSNKTKKSSKVKNSAWESEIRPPDPFPKDTFVLRQLAEQPGNFRATKRAIAIVNFIDGVDKGEIIRQSNVSWNSVKKWVDGYFQDGLDGWRAYHSSAQQVAGDNEKLAEHLKSAIKKVRRVKTRHDAVKRPLNQPKRHHMNKYLVELKGRFGQLSVSEIIQNVEELLGHGVGTLYVCDLLAIYDVILNDATSPDKR